MTKGVLVILDGYGEGKENEFNAVKNANTPFLDSLHKLPYALLKTSGEDVGIFKGELGGSEVGHTTIGAGRIVPSTAKLIHDEILNGNFKKNKNLIKVLDELNKNKGNLHLVGMMSDKNIHSDINHLYEIINIAKSKVKFIFLHLITDGRDTPPFDSLKYIKHVKSKIKDAPNCQIASIGGRFYAMDREDNVDRIETAFNTMFNEGKTVKTKEIENYLKQEHNANRNDQFVVPIKIECSFDNKLTKNDCIFMFNFREDRVRQFAKMVKEKLPCKLITMSSVGGVKSVVLYPTSIVKNTLSEYLSKQGLKQIKIGESTKYAHVTYFFNGGREEPFPLEERVHIKSTKVENFATTPKMRAGEITTEVIKAMQNNYDAIVVNYSNADMLGHTGDYEATVTSIEYLDVCLTKLAKNAKKLGYFLLLTADHGNAETMRTANGQPHLAHTLNKVFCTVVGNANYKLVKNGGLKDVAPTFVELLGLKQNKHFEGKSLLK